jgi:hypothetical protein
MIARDLIQEFLIRIFAILGICQPMRISKERKLIHHPLTRAERIPSVNSQSQCQISSPPRSQGLDQVALAAHRGQSAEVHRSLSPCNARGSWGTSCARHAAAYSVWQARAVDGSYGGDVHASRGGTFLFTVVRVSCWRTGLVGRSLVVGSRRTHARPRGGSHRVAASGEPLLAAAPLAALWPLLAALGARLYFDCWVLGFPFCKSTVMVVPRAGMGQGSPSVRVGRSPSVPSGRHGHGPAC